MLLLILQVIPQLQQYTTILLYIYKRSRNSFLASTTSPAYPVYVVHEIAWRLVVNHMCQILNVDASCSHICAN